MLRPLRAALPACVLLVFALVSLSGSSPYTLIDITPGSMNAYVTALSNGGKAIGQSFQSGTQRAYYWDGATTTVLPTLGGNSTNAVAVNDNGDVVGGSLLANNTTQHAYLYSGGTMHDLGTFGGLQSYAVGINAAGTVIGNAMDPTNQYQAFLYQNGTKTLIVPGAYYSNAADINDAGDVVGLYYATSAGQSRAFLYSGGVLTTLPTLGGANTQALRINAVGDVIGTSQASDGKWHAFLYSGGQMIDLGGSVNGAYPVALNDAGQVIGYEYTTGSSYSMFVYDHGVKTLLTFGGTYCYPEAMNAAGHVAGECGLPNGGPSRAAFYDGTTLHDLGTLGGVGSGATGISDNDVVTGYSYVDASNYHAFVYRNGTMSDLGTLGGIWSYPQYMNSSGMIAGQSAASSTVYHAFVVRPTAATTSLAVGAASGTFGGTATLTATLTAGSDGVAGRSVTFELNGQTIGTAVTDASGTAQVTGASLVTIDAGSYAAGVHASFAGDSDYLASDDHAALTVARATPDLAIASHTVAYDGQPHGLGTQALGVFGETLSPTTLTYNGSATEPAAAGTYTVVLSFAGNTNYLAATASAVLEITRRSLTVTANDASRTYGAANPSFSASYSGFVGTEDPSVLGGTLQVTTAADEHSPVATYPIVPSGLTSGNYDIAFVNGTLHVTPAALTVKANDAAREYGLPNPSFTASYSGFVNGESASVLGGVLAFSTPATVAAPVGAYGVTPAGLTSSNYSIAFVNGTLHITPAALVVMANDASRLYGAPNPALTGTTTGIRNGDAITATFATPATPASAVGDYAITSSLNDPNGRLGNYAVSQHDGVLHVTAAPLTVRAQDAGRLYGAANPAFSVSYEGLVAGDTSAALGGTLAIATPADEHSAAGTYPIVPSGLTSPNYVIAFANGMLTVSPAPLHVKAQDATREYASPDPVFTVTYAGFVAGDTEAALGGALVVSTAATQSSTVGTYAIAPAGLTSSNYTISFEPGTLTIMAVALEVTAEDATRNYGSPNPALTGTITGIRNGDAITATFATPATPASAVGDYAITSSLNDPNGRLGNYAVSQHDGVLHVTAAPLTVRAQDAGRLYGAANPAFSVSYEGLVAGDTSAALSGTLAIATPADEHSPAGTYPIVPSGLTSTNYVIAFANGTLTIGPAPLDITAQNAAREYGLPNPAFSVAYSGFVNGEGPAALTGSLAETTPATQGSAVGTYPIAPSGLSSANYDIHYHDGALTITTAPLVLTVNSATRGYGAADPPFTGTITGVRNGDAIAATYSTSATAASGTGAYPITGILSGAALGNYSATVVPGTLSITPAALTIAANDASKLQGAPNPPFTAAFSGFVLGETPAVLAGTLTFATPATASSGVGTYPITPGGVSSPNYAIAFVNGTLTVSYNVCALFDQTKANKAGSTVPIKIALCDASGVNVSSSAVTVSATTLIKVSDGASADVQDPGNANPDSNFRFTTGIYQFNLKTTGLASGTWQLGFRVAGDPVEHALQFQIR